MVEGVNPTGPDRRVVKIRSSNKPRKLSVAYERKRGDGAWDEFSVCSFDEAAPEFWEAVRALGPFLLDLLELPQAKEDCPACGTGHYGAGMKLTGLTVKYDDAGLVEGLVATLQKQLAACDAPFILNTPYAAPVAFGPGFSVALAVVQSRALDYVDGKRAQLGLFDQAGKAPAERAAEKVLGDLASEPGGLFKDSKVSFKDPETGEERTLNSEQLNRAGRKLGLGYATAADVAGE